MNFANQNVVQQSALVYQIAVYRHRHGAVFDARQKPAVQRNGMADVFVRIFKRDDVSVNLLPDAVTVIAQLPLMVRTATPVIRTRHLGRAVPF